MGKDYQEADCTVEEGCVDLDRVFNVSKGKPGNFIWEENCDNYFTVSMTKAQSLEFLATLFTFIMGGENDE